MMATLWGLKILSRFKVPIVNVTFCGRVKDEELKVYALNIKLHPRMFLKVAKASDFAAELLGDDLRVHKG